LDDLTKPKTTSPMPTDSSFIVPTDSTLMKSLINVEFCGAVYIDESEFIENWLYEPEMKNSRGMLMFLQQIYGILLLKPGMTLK